MLQHSMTLHRWIAAILLLALPATLSGVLPPELGLWWPLSAVVLCAARVFLRMRWHILLAAFVIGHGLGAATHNSAPHLEVAIMIWHLLFALTKTRVTIFGLQSQGFGLRLRRLSYFALPTTILVLLLSLGHWLIRETLQTSIFDDNRETFLLLQFLTSLCAVFVSDMVLWTLWGRPRRVWGQPGRPLAACIGAGLVAVIACTGLHFQHSRQQAESAVQDTVRRVSEDLQLLLVQQQELLFEAAAAVEEHGGSQRQFEDSLRRSKNADTEGLSSVLWLPGTIGSLGTIQLGFPAAKAFHLLGTPLTQAPELSDVAVRAKNHAAAVSPPFKIGGSTPFYAFALRTQSPRGLVLGLFRADELIQQALASLEDHGVPQYLQIRGQYTGRIAYQHGTVPEGRDWPQATAQIPIADRGGLIMAAQSPVPAWGGIVHPYTTALGLLGLLTLATGILLYRRQTEDQPVPRSRHLSAASS